MQPTDHMSIALLYFFSKIISSGARYQRVVTCADNPALFCAVYFSYFFFSYYFCYSVITARANPKSQSLTSDKSYVTRIFYGLRSRCKTWH